MKIVEFIEEYNKVAKKEEFIKKHIVVNYIPFELKCDTCKRIIQSCTHVMKGDYIAYRRSSSSQYMFFMLNLISQYTDIDIDMADPLSCFNALDSVGLTDSIIECIPDHEYVSYKTILEMESDDAYENERSMQSFLETKFATLSTVLDQLAEKLS